MTRVGELDSDASSAQPLSLPELIFSCGTCQASISEIYATPEDNKGFSSGSDDGNGIVTRLWIAECSHVTCDKHLSGGAVPFHPKGQQPQASCPQCSKTGDDTLKNLYGIRGLEEGDHDPAIPQSWFQCPPIRLDGATPGMDAVRFQFMALASYSQRMHSRWKAAEGKREAAARMMSDERKTRKQLKSELRDTKARADRDAEALKKSEASLKKWEGRMPVIRHTLNTVGPMTDELRGLRSKLLQLGYDVPLRNYGFEETSSNLPPSNTSDKLLAGKGLQPVQNVKGSSSSSRKRKRDDEGSSFNEVPQRDARHSQRMSSREMMPPPTLENLLARKTPTQQHTTVLPRMPEQHGSQRYSSNVQGLRQDTQRLSLMPNETEEFEDEPHYQGLDETTRDSQANDYRMYHGYARQPDYAPYGEGNIPAFNSSGYLDEMTPGAVSHPQGYRSNWTFQGADPRNGFQHRDGRISTDRIHQYPGTSNNSYQQEPPRQPLRPLPLNRDGLRPPQKSSQQQANSRAEDPRHISNRPAPGSVSSPFFQRETRAAHFTSMQHPMTHHANGRAKNTQFGRMEHVAQGGETPRAHVAERDVLSRRKSPAIFLEAASPTERQYYERQLVGPSGNYTWTAHTPHRVRQSYNSHAYGTPSQSSSINEPQVSSPRGRITLPPSSARAQDYQLANIKGLRGSYPQQAEAFPAHNDLKYSGSRPLFSAASRRSVRR